MERTRHITIALLAASALLVAALPGVALGAPSDEGLPDQSDGTALSLDQAVQQVIDQAPAISASEAGTQASEARVTATRASWWPQLLVVAAYRYAAPIPKLDIQIPGAPPGTGLSKDIGTEHTAYGGLELRWRPLDISRSATISAAEQQMTAAELSTEDKVLALEERTRRLYLTIRYLDEVLAVTAMARDNAVRALEDRQALLDAGLGSEVDVAAGKARVAELDARRVEAETNRDAAEKSLKTLLGAPDGDHLVLTDGFEVLTEKSIRASSRELKEHPSVLSLKAEAIATRSEAEAAWSRWYPTIDVRATVDYRYPQTFVDNEAGPTWSAGVQLTWLVWDGGARDAQQDALLAKASAQEHAAEAQQEALTLEAADAHATIDAAESKLQSAEARQDAAKAYLDLAQASVDAGAANELDVTNAEVEVDQAGLAVATARYDLALAYSALMKARGIRQSAPAASVSGADGASNNDSESP